MAAMIAGTAITAGGTLAAGNAAEAEGEFAAKQYDIKAKEERAASQREAIQQRKETGLILSRQQALAASSGLGALDPTILDLAGDTVQEGGYREDLMRYGGEERAAGLRLQGESARFSGDNAQRGSMWAAAGTLLSGIGSAGMYGKYGEGGPPGSRAASRGPAYG